MTNRRIERYLEEHINGTSFTVHDYAGAMGLDTTEASADIQSQLSSQRSGADVAYLMYRMPGTRTRNARWMVGHKVRDARRIGRALADDTKAKALRAFAKDLHRLAILNPKRAALAESMVESVVDHAIAILDAAAQGLDGDA